MELNQNKIDGKFLTFKSYFQLLMVKFGYMTKTYISCGSKTKEALIYFNQPKFLTFFGYKDLSIKGTSIEFHSKHIVDPKYSFIFDATTEEKNTEVGFSYGSERGLLFRTHVTLENKYMFDHFLMVMGMYFTNEEDITKGKNFEFTFTNKSGVTFESCINDLIIGTTLNEDTIEFISTKLYEVFPEGKSLNFLSSFQSENRIHRIFIIPYLALAKDGLYACEKSLIDQSMKRSYVEQVQFIINFLTNSRTL